MVKTHLSTSAARTGDDLLEATRAALDTVTAANAGWYADCGFPQPMQLPPKSH